MTSATTGIAQRTANSLRRAWQTHPDLMATVLLLLVAIPTRLLVLGTDPPTDLQAHFFPDEGLWAHNARVHELFGVWVADDHNPPLVLAPLYTLVLTAFYRVLGFGLVTTRLVSATSGILSCLILYGAVRAIRTPGRALSATLIFALSYFVISYQRVAFTEAHQLLWAVTGLAGVLWARRTPRWALLGGVGLALAQLVKPSALLLFPIVLGYWLWRQSPRDDEPPVLRLPWLEVAWFGVGAILIAIPVAIVVVANWSFVWGYLVVSLRSLMEIAYTPRVDLIPGLFRLPATGFAQQSLVQVVAVGVLAWQRGLRMRSDRPDDIERIAWIWLGFGLLSLGFINYQPDRRFLLLSVPLAILCATAVEGPSAPRLPAQASPVGAARRALSGALLGGGLGWATIALGMWLGIDVVPVRWSQLWIAAVLGGSLATLLLPFQLLRTAATARLIWLMPIFLLLEPVRYSLNLRLGQQTVLDAARRVAALTDGLPPEDQVIIGFGGPTLALESKLFAITERGDPNIGAFLNRNAWNRFHPAFALRHIPPGWPRATGGAAGTRGFQLCTTFLLLPDKHRVPTIELELWIRPDLASRCGPRAPDSR